MDTTISKKVLNFFSQFKELSYKKGEILIRADDDPAGIFYLVKGEVKEYAISKKGEELIINVFKKQSFFPMSWAINQTHNEYFFEAMTDVTVYRASREDSIDFIKKNPDVAYNLLSRVYKGVDGLLTRMTYLMGGDAYTRLVIELLLYAKRFGDGKTAIEITISEKDIAAQSGMARETVSREIKVLKEKGIIVSKKNVLVINDINMLRKEIS
ncbi:MAG TPA: Crp/Fnr family transcriptional regulator [Candidatus Levybacteria bacterium]|nr:Crp/Fnr family transcriptional regulator [Candidatus Levybacteria bacterium]